MTPRRLAVKALIHQEQAGYANLVLDAELKKCTPPLDSRDAAFAARIFYTTLERLPLLDYRINQFTKKPVAKLDAPVRAVLRAGLAQALYMNVPLPAAVNESVKLTRALGKSSAAGMVNAVLRRAAAADDQMSPRPILPTLWTGSRSTTACPARWPSFSIRSSGRRRSPWPPHFMKSLRRRSASTHCARTIPP